MTSKPDIKDEYLCNMPVTSSPVGIGTSLKQEPRVMGDHNAAGCPSRPSHTIRRLLALDQPSGEAHSASAHNNQISGQPSSQPVGASVAGPSPAVRQPRLNAASLLNSLERRMYIFEENQRSIQAGLTVVQSNLAAVQANQANLQSSLDQLRNAIAHQMNPPTQASIDPSIQTQRRPR